MPSRISLVSLLLFTSGACALIFQTAWLREFRLIFGATTPASAAVLAIFMGGLGLGNLILGRRADQIGTPLRLYAQFELSISALAILSPLMVQLIRAIYLAIGGQEALGVVGATILRLVLASLVIGPATFLMGGTLPAAARAVTSSEDESRGDVGWLYGLNTLGAVLGALVSTFLLLELLGNRETLWLAGAINFANGLLAWSLSSRLAVLPNQPARVPIQKQNPKHEKPATKHAPKAGSPSPASRAQMEPSPGDPQLIYGAAAIVGFVFFLMELVWYRMLAAILGGTTFTFGLILAVALAGIGIGGALYPVLYRNRTPSIRDFGLSCGWEALAIAVPFALGDWLALFALVMQSMRYFGFYGQVFGWAIVAALVILPAAIASGVQFPLLIALLGRGSRDLGRQLGQAFAWNTAGAMLGSLAGGFGLLPLLSAPGAWRFGAIVLIALALFALALHYYRVRVSAPLLHPLITTAIAAFCLTAIGPTAVWRHTGIGAGRARPPAPASVTRNELKNWMYDRRRQISWEADGLEASVAITTGGGVAFLVNGKSDGNSVTDAATQIMFPVLGAILHPDPRDSLVIGLGTGESAGWLAALPTSDQVDVVELERVVTEVAHQCTPLNHDVLHHPKIRLAYNDAREMVQTTRRQYDLIASEPSNPYRAGVCGLYTLDFYRHARQRLKPRGLFMQWLQGYEVDIPTIRMVLTTLSQVFSHIEVWETKPSDMVVICANEPIDYDLARIQERLADPIYREALRIGWRTTRVEGLLAHFVASERFVTKITAGRNTPINTDDRNLLEYRFARTVGRGADFTVAQFREDARQLGLAQPTPISDGVDWEAVDDQRFAYHAAVSDPPLILPPATGERMLRGLALQHYYQDNLAGVLTAWQAQPKPPEDLIENVVLALAYAERGDSKARPLIEKIQANSPIEAQVLLALLLFQEGQTAQAAETIEKAFIAMRTDATVMHRLVDGAFSLIVRISQRDPQQCPRLHAATSEPLALFMFNERRRMTRCLLAQSIGPAPTAVAIDDMEPHIPWDEPFLTTRRNAYVAVGSPLAEKAGRDLDDFLEHASQPHVLPRQ